MPNFKNKSIPKEKLKEAVIIDVKDGIDPSLWQRRITYKLIIDGKEMLVEDSEGILKNIIKKGE